MTNTSTSALEAFDPRAPISRITEILAENAMPSATEGGSALLTGSTFPTELPAVPRETEHSAPADFELPPMPSNTALSQAVSNAMDEPPVPMPTTIKPPSFSTRPHMSNGPVPFPRTVVSTSIQPEPIEQTSAATPFITEPANISSGPSAFAKASSPFDPSAFTPEDDSKDSTPFDSALEQATEATTQPFEPTPASDDSPFESETSPFDSEPTPFDSTPSPFEPASNSAESKLPTFDPASYVPELDSSPFDSTPNIPDSIPSIEEERTTLNIETETPIKNETTQDTSSTPVELASAYLSNASSAAASSSTSASEHDQDESFVRISKFGDEHELSLEAKDTSETKHNEYQETLPGFEEIEQNATDAQLIEALLPVVESSLEKALYAPKTGLHMYLEPMLRATVRRAIAEQMQTIHHFGQINLIDRCSWRMKALFTSRTYDDIVFDRTHRYRVEEVYLLRHESNSLISYASHDPSRHSSPRKIKYDLERLVEELKGDDGELRKSFELPNNNTAVVRCGQNCFLLASIRGPINALVRADLDYVLSQVEQRFGDRLRDPGQHFVHVLQPLLEGCLLIQSPPPPR